MSHLNSRGYVIVLDSLHPLADVRGRVLEHRKVWFDRYGSIPIDGVVHHKNGDRTDNRPENLELHTRSQHAQYHYPDSSLDYAGTPAEQVTSNCAQCGKTFVRLAHRVRETLNRGWRVCCSKVCALVLAREAHRLRART